MVRALHERVYPAPPELVKFLNLDNKLNGYPNRPLASEPSLDMHADIQQAIAELPTAVKMLVNKEWIGIFLVTDLGGTAFISVVNDENGKTLAGFIVLDTDAINRRANEWATWKENTPFKQDNSEAGFHILATIENPQLNTRRNAIQYILLHELGHLVAITNEIHPSWKSPVSEIANIDSYPFTMQSWTIATRSNPQHKGGAAGKLRYVSNYDDQFTDRESVVYYFGPKLGSQDMVSVYEELEQTNFPTLYAATNLYDDFAESFVTYVHSEIMHRPFRIEIKQGNQTIKTFGLCWKEARCANKKELLQNLFSTSTESSDATTTMH